MKLLLILILALYSCNRIHNPDNKESQIPMDKNDSLRIRIIYWKEMWHYDEMTINDSSIRVDRYFEPKSSSRFIKTTRTFNSSADSLSLFLLNVDYFALEANRKINSCDHATDYGFSINAFKGADTIRTGTPHVCLSDNLPDNNFLKVMLSMNKLIQNIHNLP